MTMLLVVLLSTITHSQISPTTINATGEFYISSITTMASQTITCNSDTKCVVECNTSDGCDNLLIYGSNTTDLVIHCRELSSCSYMKLLSAPTNSLDLNCINDAACNYMEINAATTPTVDIQCSYDICWSGLCYSNQGPCYRSIINVEYSNNVYLQCGYHYNCNKMELHVNNSGTVLIDGDGDSSMDNTNVFGTDITKKK
eukprot:330425_1